MNHLLSLFQLAALLSLDMYLPPLSWADSLPCREQCLLALRMNSEYQEILRVKRHLYPGQARGIEERIEEAKRRRILWDLSDDAVNEMWMPWRRRMQLKRLMELMDYRDVCDMAERLLPWPVIMEK